jgi:hypothetical protein
VAGRREPTENIGSVRIAVEEVARNKQLKDVYPLQDVQSGDLTLRLEWCGPSAELMCETRARTHAGAHTHRHTHTHTHKHTHTHTHLRTHRNTEREEKETQRERERQETFREGWEGTRERERQTGRGRAQRSFLGRPAAFNGLSDLK